MGSLLPENISVILVEPSQPGNIGSVSRAMHNMGLTDLRLINPCEVDHPEARAFAKNARSILFGAKVFERLEDAIEDRELIIGTSARFRDKIHSSTSIRDLDEILNPFPAKTKIALLFGRENSGLNNHEMSLCNEWIHIPTYSDNNSLNLAQAVIVTLFELSKFYDAKESFSGKINEPATSKQVEGMKQHFFEILKKVKFVRKNTGEAIWNSFACMIGRAKPEARDIRMIRGLFSQIEISLSRKDKKIEELKKDQ